MTDERQGAALWRALARLPRGSGVVVRHYGVDERERLALIARVRRIARRRGLVLIVAGPERLALRIGADGFHERSAHIGDPRLLRTVAAHDAAEIEIARRARADLVFVSPVFATRSHPGARAIGRVRFGLLARRAAMPAIALGGMTAKRARSVSRLGAYGWAAIGALTPGR